jgi:hypothetical protein
MSTNVLADIEASWTDDQFRPVLTKCIIANKLVEEFYDSIAQMTFDLTDESRVDNTELRKEIKSLERQIVASASAKKRVKLKKAAVHYAQLQVLFRGYYCAQAYANAEIRLRKLEILTATSRIQTSEALNPFVQQQVTRLLAAEQRWRECFSVKYDL